MDQSQRAYYQRRIMRRQVWVSLWLARLSGWLQFICGDARLALWLNKKAERIAAELMAIIFCQAALRFKPKAARRSQVACGNTKYNWRSMIGCDLRRAFKAKTLQERLENIRSALEQTETLIARLSRRLRRGMSRLLSAPSRVAIVKCIGLEMTNTALIALVLGGALLCADSDTS